MSAGYARRHGLAAAPVGFVDDRCRNNEWRALFHTSRSAGFSATVSDLAYGFDLKILKHPQRSISEIQKAIMEYKTPGVYINEVNVFPSSVVEVETAVPAFVGYTQRAERERQTLTGKAMRISSLAEYEKVFGGPSERGFILHPCLKLFFLNGGGPCYIVSVGDYSAVAIDPDALITGVEKLLLVPDATLLVIPEAVLLEEPECIRVQLAMLTHCGEKMRNRVAILDIWGGAPGAGNVADWENNVTVFRDHIGGRFLDFAAAYYPWVNTAAFGEADRLLPPSAAIAGMYAAVDKTCGVWNAPANVGLAGITGTSVTIPSDEQENLNNPQDGKAVNAIRSFPGQGVSVWGSRTLDGNSPHWRYIHVRRTAIMIEESCRLASQFAVFAPNTATTWVTVKNRLSDFLIDLWKKGALAGSTAADAFSVSVGLGETMTADDLLEGILLVSVRLAIVRPGEFIQITYQQQLQK